MPEKNNLK